MIPRTIFAAEHDLFRDTVRRFIDDVARGLCPRTGGDLVLRGGRIRVAGRR